MGLRGEPTGCPTGFRADAVATAKRALKVGELLDGEGGYTVVGRLMPAADSISVGALPLGLAHGWKVLRPIAAGEVVRWSDVAVDANNTAVKVLLRPVDAFPSTSAMTTESDRRRGPIESAALRNLSTARRRRAEIVVRARFIAWPEPER